MTKPIIHPTWRVYWSPEGRAIATVTAKHASSAIRKAPHPYRRYLGELYAVKQENETVIDCATPTHASTHYTKR